MQSWYNEAVARKDGEAPDSAVDSNTAEESKTDRKNGDKNAANATTASSDKKFGEDGYRYPQLDFPCTREDLGSYNISVKKRIEAKYETLTKNVHFYLTYLFLEIGDYRNAVKHGETVLKNYAGRLLKKTQFTVMQYLGEAYCMLGKHQEALEMLDES